MQVKLLVSRAGDNEDGTSFVQSAGEVIEVSDALGEKMIDAGQALEVVEGEKGPEVKPRKPRKPRV